MASGGDKGKKKRGRRTLTVPVDVVPDKVKSGEQKPAQSSLTGSPASRGATARSASSGVPEKRKRKGSSASSADGIPAHDDEKLLLQDVDETTDRTASSVFDDVVSFPVLELPEDQLATVVDRKGKPAKGSATDSDVPIDMSEFDEAAPPTVPGRRVMADDDETEVRRPRDSVAVALASGAVSAEHASHVAALVGDDDDELDIELDDTPTLDEVRRSRPPIRLPGRHAPALAPAAAQDEGEPEVESFPDKTEEIQRGDFFDTSSAGDSDQDSDGGAAPRESRPARPAAGDAPPDRSSRPSAAPTAADRQKTDRVSVSPDDGDAPTSEEGKAAARSSRPPQASPSADGATSSPLVTGSAATASSGSGSTRTSSVPPDANQGRSVFVGVIQMIGQGDATAQAGLSEAQVEKPPRPEGSPRPRPLAELDVSLDELTDDDDLAGVGPSDEIPVDTDLSELGSLDATMDDGASEEKRPSAVADSKETKRPSIAADSKAKAKPSILDAPRDQKPATGESKEKKKATATGEPKEKKPLSRVADSKATKRASSAEDLDDAPAADEDEVELDLSEAEEVSSAGSGKAAGREGQRAKGSAEAESGQSRRARKDSAVPPPPPARPSMPEAPARPSMPEATPPPPPPSATPSLLGGLSPRRRLWWEELFDDSYLHSIPAFSERQTQKEVDFIQAGLGVTPGGMILDVACGAGRHAVELATRGFNVVGLDLSLAMLARASELSQEHAQKVNFIQGDMRAMAFESTFDGACFLGTSIGYFEDETNVKVIEGIHRALKAKGMLIIEAANRDYLINHQPNMVWFEGRGCVCMEETSFNYITSRLKVKRTMLYEDGRQVEQEFAIRAYCLHELGKILHNAGFRVSEVSGHVHTPGAFFGPDSTHLIILAEKRSE
jgi:SAM-dependent methyltransferase